MLTRQRIHEAEAKYIAILSLDFMSLEYMFRIGSATVVLKI